MRYLVQRVVRFGSGAVVTQPLQVRATEDDAARMVQEDRNVVLAMARCRVEAPGREARVMDALKDLGIVAVDWCITVLEDEALVEPASPGDMQRLQNAARLIQ